MTKYLNCYRCNKILEPGEVIETRSLESEETRTFCDECYGKDAPPESKRGRPSLGKTTKISLTISEGEWGKLDKKANGNRSKYIRELVLKDLESPKIKLPKLYYKDELHEKLTFHYSSLMGISISNLFYDKEAYVSCYILASLTTKRFDDFIIKGKKIKVRALQKKIGPYSSTEKNMIRFAVQICCGPNVDGIPLVNVFRGLDSHNVKIIKAAINYLY